MLLCVHKNQPPRAENDADENSEGEPKEQSCEP